MENIQQEQCICRTGPEEIIERLTHLAKTMSGLTPASARA